MKIEKELIESARGLFVRYTPVFSPGVLGSGEIRFPFYDCEVGDDRVEHQKQIAAALANARGCLRTFASQHSSLVAAAPAMFEALQALVGEADLGEVDLSEEDRRRLDAARAALALAQGKVYTYETAPDDYSEGEAQP